MNNNDNGSDGKSIYWGSSVTNVATSPLGNRVGVCFHNCYGKTKAETQAKIKLACDENRGFSLIEFDVISNDNVVRISHNDGENGSISLVEALDIEELKASKLILFLEIKENWHTETRSVEFMRKLLTMVRDRGYVGAARPLVLRAITNTSDHRDKHLLVAKQLLEDEFSEIRDHVRFHTLFTGGSKDVRDGIKTTKLQGFHGVEVDENTANLFGALMHAKLLGLGAGVFTPTTTNFDPVVFLAALREDIDFYTTNYNQSELPVPVQSSPKSLIEAGTSVLYMNTAQQTRSPLNYKLFNDTNDVQVSDSMPPSLEIIDVLDPFEDRVGGSMLFEGKQYITTKKIDSFPKTNVSTAGILVTAVVNFDGSGSSSPQSIVANSDSGGFALERGSGNCLRFGVYVNGAYHYATSPSIFFDNTHSYFIVGAFDGKGKVRLFVNNKLVATSPGGELAGEVRLGTSPIVIGADPQGLTDRRYFFGKIQQVMVQGWNDH